MVSVLDNIDTKKRILEVCITKLQAFTQEVKARMMNSMQKRIAKNAMAEGAALMSAAEGNSDPNVLEQDLDNAIKDLRILKYLLNTSEEEHDKVGLGAVVVTHRNTFFVSADLQRLDIDGDKYIAISNQCPLFKSMRGKRRGERFIHKDLSYQILDIY
jgi:hypothetical protein